MSNIQLSKVKYIAFDFCGTLADIFPTTGSILSQFFRENYQLEFIPAWIFISKNSRIYFSIEAGQYLGSNTIK